MGIFVRLGRIIKSEIAGSSVRPQLDRRQIISGFMRAHENILLPGARSVISNLDGQQKLQNLQALGKILSGRTIWGRAHNYRIERLTLSLSPADEIRPMRLGGEIKLTTNKDRANLASRLSHIVGADRTVSIIKGVMTIPSQEIQLLTNGNGGAYRAAALPEGNGHAPVVEASVAVPAAEIILPEMIALSDRFSIMKGELRVGLFKQVMQGYEITGHNADKLQAILDDPSKADDALTHIILYDAREFARRLSEQTGRKFRVQTEEEWLQARDQLTGNNWTWTETEHEKHPGKFVLRHLDGSIRLNLDPEHRHNDYAVRLVEDK